MCAGTNPADEEGPANRQAYNRLVAALAAKPVIALVGAGLSMRVGYSSWSGLVRALTDKACKASRGDADRLTALLQGNDYLVCAGACKQTLGAEAFGSLVAETFGRRTPQYDAAYLALVSLPFRHLLTTNYDPALVEAYRSVFDHQMPAVHLEEFDQSLPLMNGFARPDSPAHCVYVHGSIAKPAEIVLTLEDYNRVYEIDSIFKFVELGHPDAAIEQYRAILGRPEAVLSERLKYRLHANIGNALYAKRERTAAAEAYLEAVSFYRASKEAHCIEVLAYFLREDDDNAQQLAVALCQDEPGYGRAHALRIRTLPDDVSLEDAEASASDLARTDAEVMVALADLAGARGRLEVKEEYLRRAVAQSPKWLEAKALLASVLLTSEKVHAEFDTEVGPTLPDSARVEEAEALLDDVIAEAPPTDASGLLAGAYLNRAPWRGVSAGGKPTVARTWPTRSGASRPSRRLHSPRRLSETRKAT